MRRRAVSWGVRRRELRGSHWMWRKADATGEGGMATGGAMVSKWYLQFVFWLLLSSSIVVVVNRRGEF